MTEIKCFMTINDNYYLTQIAQISQIFFFEHGLLTKITRTPDQY